jgi:uncharacterized iron-regulated membrane protein
MATAVASAQTRASFYRAVWRWHFYAGLFCVPFVVILAITGSIYLFKPQVESWIDSRHHDLVVTGPRASADQQVAAALAAHPEASLRSYILPAAPNDGVQMILRLPEGGTRLVTVDPHSLAILDSIDPEDRFMAIVRTIHGELLMGERGSYLVELAACWAIVMILTGLYLWWPRQASGLAGVVYPRLSAGGRVFWRDLHAVTGVWVSAFALFLLTTGLPWASVWGDAFKQVREWTGTTAGPVDWTQSRATEQAQAAHEHHDHAGHHDPAARQPAVVSAVTLQQIVDRAMPLALPAPVAIRPPGGGAHGLALPKDAPPVWIVTSETPNRPLRATVAFDATTGAQLMRQDFADRHLIDRIIGYGIAAHEGQLFGPLNQALGVLTALGLVTLSVSGMVMWWRRRPDGVLGAPPTSDYRITAGLAGIIVVLGLLMPLLGLSLLVIALVELLLLRRIPPVAKVLGLAR